MTRRSNNWTPGESKSGMTIGKVAEMCLLNGMSSADTLERVKRVFPEANTTMKCIYYYRSQLRQKGLLGPTQEKVVNNNELAKLQKELAKAKKDVA